VTAQCPRAEVGAALAASGKATATRPGRGAAARRRPRSKSILYYSYIHIQQVQIASPPVKNWRGALHYSTQVCESLLLAACSDCARCCLAQRCPPRMAIKWLAQLLAVPALAATAAALPHGQASQLGAGVGDEALVAALRRSNYISIPGPNPLLRARHEDDNGDDHGAGASWPGEGTMMEFGDIFRDFDTVSRADSGSGGAVFCFLALAAHSIALRSTTCIRMPGPSPTGTIRLALPQPRHLLGHGHCETTSTQC
jgi:hypothetical protein